MGTELPKELFSLVLSITVTFDIAETSEIFSALTPISTALEDKASLVSKLPDGVSMSANCLYLGSSNKSAKLMICWELQEI